MTAPAVSHVDAADARGEERSDGRVRTVLLLVPSVLVIRVVILWLRLRLTACQSDKDEQCYVCRHHKCGVSFSFCLRGRASSFIFLLDVLSLQFALVFRSACLQVEIDSAQLPAPGRGRLSSVYHLKRLNSAHIA